MHRRDRAGVLGVFVVFVACGVAQALWAMQLPWFRAVLALSDRDTGLLAGALSTSCCTGLAISSGAMRRVPAARLLSVAAAAIVVGAVLLQAAPAPRSVTVLAMALVVLGLGIGTADVAANVLGGAVEQRTGRVLLPLLHAGFSAGLVAGAVLELLANASMGRSGAAIPVGLCVAAASAGLLALRVADGHLSNIRPTPSGPAEHRLPWSAAASLGVVLALAAAVEGIGDTWVPILASDRVVGSGGPSPAVVYLSFTASVLVSRIVVHLAGRRWSRVVLLRAALLVAGSGLVVVAVDGTTFPVAVALWGAGTGVAFPLLVSEAAARSTGSSAVVPVVTAAGYAGFLVGPAATGALAQSVGHAAIPVVCAVLAVTALVVASAFLRPTPAVSFEVVSHGRDTDGTATPPRSPSLRRWHAINSTDGRDGDKSGHKHKHPTNHGHGPGSRERHAPRRRGPRPTSGHKSS